MLTDPIRVTFKEPMSLSAGISAFEKCFELSTGGKKVNFTVIASADRKTFTLLPERIYCETTYTVSIVNNTIENAAGIHSYGAATWTTAKQLLLFDNASAVRKGITFFLPGGTNRISFKALANDVATYKLMYKKGSTWIVVSTKKTLKDGTFTWDWNGKVNGKYLPASKTPYQFKVVKIYHGKTTDVKNLKLIIQSSPTIKVKAPTQYAKTELNPMGIAVSYNKFSDVKVEVFDANWKSVKVLLNKKNQAPNYNKKVYWDARDANGNYVSAGYYYVKTTIGGKVVIKKVLILDYYEVNK